MPVRTEKRKDTLVHTADLSRVPDLDMTSPRWNLSDGQASEVLGLDVVTPGNFYQPEFGRMPVGGTLGFISELVVQESSLSSVCELNADAWVKERKFFTNIDLHSASEYRGFHLRTGTTASYTHSTGILLRTDFFTKYAHRVGDRICIHSPKDLRGTHSVLEKIDNSSIRIRVQNSSARDATVDEAILIQGRWTCMGIEVAGSTIGRPEIAGTFALLVKGPDLYDVEGPWSDDVHRGHVILNEDQRAGNYYSNSLMREEVYGAVTYARRNDAVVVGSGTGWATTNAYRCTIQYSAHHDHRGFLVSDGRRFWLHQKRQYSLLLDLGDDSFLGTQWRAGRIAANRFLLTSPKHIPRVLHLARGASLPATIEYPEEVLAGCIAPRKDFLRGQVDQWGNINDPSWRAKDVGTETTHGNLSAGTGMKVMVRGVSLVDNVVSGFVHVTEASVDLTPGRGVTADSTIATVEGGSVGIAPLGFASTVGIFPIGFGPVMHRRMDYLEVWRTAAVYPTTYYLESRIPIDHFSGEPWGSSLTGARGLIIGDLDTEYSSYGSSHYPIELNDDDLPGLTVLTSAELAASVGLPPICREVVSLLGVTLCFGKADVEKEEPPLYSRDFYCTAATYSGGNRRFTCTDFFTKYSFKKGDQLVVLFGGAEGGETVRPGVYDIVASTANYVELDNTTGSPDPGGGNITDANHAPWIYIRRPVRLDWPGIADDEDVWYSRTDEFQPENFPVGLDGEPRTLQLSRIGDAFRKAVIVGKYVVVVMEKGIHLLWISNGILIKDTISASTDGTPWENSVIVIGNQVLWATTRGVRILTISNEPDDAGHRGRLSYLPDTNSAEWFQDALDAGDRVDAGYDSKNAALRFRRKMGDHQYQVLQYGFFTKKMTILDDDNGIGYASSSVAEMEEKKVSSLYSIDERTGAVFEVNSSGDSYPYDGRRPQDVIGEGYSIHLTTSPTRKMILFSPGLLPFSSEMIGDIIRFRSSNPNVDGQVRTVLLAGESTLLFDPVEGLAIGDEFIIGAVRFRIRLAPFRGTQTDRVKTIQSVTARLQPGKRSTGRTPKVSVYENFSDEKADSETVEVFPDSEAGKTSEDRAVPVEGQGLSLELELESLDTRGDFRVEYLEAVIEEESSEVADTET